MQVNPAAVEASGWGWRHATRKDFALRAVDFTIRPGERVLLLGASGAGKSTMMAGLAGVLGGDEEGEQEGSLTIDGVDAREARGRVGLVLQDPDSQIILERLGDDAAFGCENLNVPREEIWQRVRESLDMVGLGGLELDRSTRHLSGGQRQRLALAGVLAMKPGLLLLDEPTANLDPEGVVEVHDAAEMARASGITLAGPLDPVRATSRGTGEMIADAMRRGARRFTIAIGGSATSANLMGISTRSTTIRIYMLSTGLATLAGIVFSVYTQAGYALAGVGVELDAIASVVIGGTLLSGGVGTVLGTLFGVAIQGLIQTYINFDGTLSSWWTKIAIGVLLFVFIALQRGLTVLWENRQSSPVTRVSPSASTTK